MFVDVVVERDHLKTGEEVRDLKNSVTLPLSHVVYHVLLALSTESRHGYGIIQHVSERTGGRVRLEAGTLYAAIKRLRDAEWIQPAPSDPGSDSRRRTYSLTTRGERGLLAECQRLEQMVELARDARVLPQRSRGKAQA